MQAGHTHLINEAETDSLALGLTRSGFAMTNRTAGGLHRPTGPLPATGYPANRGPPLHGERTITAADTFQSANRTRLRLAHITQKKVTKNILYDNGMLFIFYKIC
jgi:hypothetical protein